MIVDSVAGRKDLLERSTTVAMIGASANHLRPSYTVFSYLRTMTRLQVVPINPTLDEIDGVPAYASLREYAARFGAPDIVDVFRKPSEVLDLTAESISVGAKCIWFQYGVINEEAIRLADDAGLAVVVDRCIKVEWARLSGGLSTSGLHSGLISSRRRSPQ